MIAIRWKLGLVGYFIRFAFIIIIIAIRPTPGRYAVGPRTRALPSEVPRAIGGRPENRFVRSPRIGRTWRPGRRDIWTRTRCACRRSDTSRRSRDVRTGTIRRCDLSPTAVWPVPPTFPENVRTVRPNPISANTANMPVTNTGVVSIFTLTRAARVAADLGCLELDRPAWTEEIVGSLPVFSVRRWMTTAAVDHG